MKVIFAVAASLLSVQVFADTKSFDVKAEVSINGKLISRPHIVTKPNELASISQMDENKRETIIEVIASDYSSEKIKDGIMMRFTVSYNDNGKRTVISKPQIVSISGETAEILVGEKEKTDALKIKVVATRVR